MFTVNLTEITFQDLMHLLEAGECFEVNTEYVPEGGVHRDEDWSLDTE